MRKTSEGVRGCGLTNAAVCTCSTKINKAPDWSKAETQIIGIYMNVNSYCRKLSLSGRIVIILSSEIGQQYIRNMTLFFSLFFWST